MRCRLVVIIFCFGWLTACINRQGAADDTQQPASAPPVREDSIAGAGKGTPQQVAALPARADTAAARSNISPDTTGDEQKFRIALAVLQQAVKKNDTVMIKKCIRFPLQTCLQWTNEDLKTTQVDKAAGKVAFYEFSEYYPNIFHAAVKRLLPKAGESALQEIDEKMNEDYYNTLRQGTDKGSKLYEVYEQYPEKSGHAESFFAFVFGRIAGEYKVVAYYAKWPVKG
ncbi:hypothetical protein [Chitinophaga sp. sic0106]|uniref:hypothetical protein n=1 Tax=Chitinophaga sp. sic0106 TaxID=2854785 RepID=UPI001C439159|nr:hypothetical protein [Chitinophaga sp. sic0106]MBV7529412.1 hypothetical protein [Chitinophaga sp. sic0106]